MTPIGGDAVASTSRSRSISALASSAAALQSSRFGAPRLAPFDLELRSHLRK